MKSNRIGRVVEILTAVQSGKSYSVGDLSQMFKTSQRTIFRDLKELRAIGVPYRYDAKIGGYTIDPEFFLPPIDLNLQEALSLLLAVHKVADQMQLPFRKSALLAALKVENNLPGRIKQYCNTALQKISTKAIPQATTSILDKTFAQLQNAVTKKRQVTIRYNSLFEGKIINLELCPYHLLYNHRAWYVLGLSSLHNSIRTFKLNRIKELKTLDKGFVDDEHFDLQDYLGKAWSMIPEGKIYNIVLRFSPKVAENVTEVRWHTTQKVVRNCDGSAVIEFRVDGLGEIIWWLLGYGDQVQIIAPALLRKRVVKIAKNMVKLNDETTVAAEQK